MASPPHNVSGTFVQVVAGSGTQNETLDSGSSGSNRCLVLGVTGLRTTANQLATVTVTYNGVSMVVVVSDSRAATQAQRPDLTILQLVAPATGSNTLAITFANGYDSYEISWAVYDDVDQTTPVDDFDINDANSTSASVSLTTTGVDRTVVNIGGWRMANGTPPIGNVDTGTKRVEDNTAVGSDDTAGMLGDYPAASAATYTDSITLDNTNQMLAAIVALSPAAAAAPTANPAALLMGL